MRSQREKQSLARLFYPATMRSLAFVFLFASSLMFVGGAAAQTLEPRPPDPLANANGNALSNPGLTPQIEFLYQLEAKFAADTAKGGGKAFGDYFAPDAVTLENGGAPVVGHDAIASRATWTPESYQLTWTPEGARMGPAGDMGFTWGHYESNSKDAEGKPVKETGRYMTVWKKQSDGSWKVVLDASNQGPADDCCRVK
ncbi:MAG TPA: nuclear transport factor 2 family protein [Acidobacteriaceae bacterium]